MRTTEICPRYETVPNGAPGRTFPMIRKRRDDRAGQAPRVLAALAIIRPDEGRGDDPRDRVPCIVQVYNPEERPSNTPVVGWYKVPEPDGGGLFVAYFEDCYDPPRYGIWAGSWAEALEIVESLEFARWAGYEAPETDGGPDPEGLRLWGPVRYDAAPPVLPEIYDWEAYDPRAARRAARILGPQISSLSAADVQAVRISRRAALELRAAAAVLAPIIKGPDEAAGGRAAEALQTLRAVSAAAGASAWTAERAADEAFSRLSTMTAAGNSGWARR